MYHIILWSALVLICMHCILCTFCRKKIFSGVRHFAHANLSAALLLGLTIFIGGVEHASSSKVSPKICPYLVLLQLVLSILCSSFLMVYRVPVWLWPFYSITSSWLHFAGCSVKGCCYLLFYGLCSTRDSLKAGNSFHYLAGVSFTC